MERITASLRLDDGLCEAMLAAYPGCDLSAIANAAMHEAMLRRVLPLEEYGKVIDGGRSKTFDDLIKEIRGKECYIQWEDHRPTRLVRVAEIHVVSHDGRSLRELKQVFADGTERDRGYDWCAEKIRVGESPWSAATRCLMEELGLSIRRERLHSRGCRELKKGSGSYPGLPSVYTIRSFGVVLKKSEWKVQYIEEQPDKVTYFGWD